MGIVFRQSAKNLVVVVIGALMGAVVIWMSTKYNTKQQLGSIGSLTNYAVQLSQMLLFGLNNTLIIFIHRYTDNPAKKKLLISLCFGGPLIIAGIFTVVFIFLRGWVLHHFQPVDLPFMQKYYLWLPVYIVFFIYMVLLEQYLGSQLRVAVSAFMREVVLRAANIILLLLFGFGYIDFNALVIGTILIYPIPVLVFFVLSTKTKYFGFSLRFTDFSKAEYKEIASFSWYHFLFNVSVLLLFTMDVTLLPFYDHKGFSSVAVYRVAVFLISFLLLPYKALLPASLAVLAKAFADGDLHKAKDLFTRSSLNVLILTVGVAALICCNLENAVSVIKNGYSDIIPVFLILSIGMLIYVASGMNEHVLSITNYYKFNFFMSLTMMLVLFVMLRTLIPRYGIYGAAASATFAISISSIIKCYFVWRKLGMQPYSRNTLLVLAAILPAVAAGYYFPYFFEPSRHVYIHSFMDAIMRSTLIVIVYASMLLWLKPSKDLQEYIASVKKNKRLF